MIQSQLILAKCSANPSTERPLQEKVLGTMVARRGKTWQHFIGENSITLLLGSSPNNHCLYIDVTADRIYLDGQRILTTQPEFNYNKGLMFQKNKGNEKKRLRTLKFCGKVLCIDAGFDGRIFFKIFTEQNYKRFRAPPITTYSYWHDKKEGLKKFYAGDLHNPTKTWPVKYKAAK